MKSLLKDKHAIITGGTAGIGREIAIAFAQSGAHVAIFGTNSERASEVVQILSDEKAFPEQQFISKIVDVSHKESVDKAIQELLQEWSKIDILVNNAGITRDSLLMKMKEEDWDQVIDVNLKSIYNTCQPLVRAMLKAKSGKIINISSVVGLMGNTGQANYAASKAGMIGFTKALAKELASRNICVNCIAPGFIKTPMSEVLSEDQKKSFLEQIPMGRFGTPQEVAQTALFLASSLSGYITGQVISVSGGM